MLLFTFNFDEGLLLGFLIGLIVQATGTFKLAERLLLTHQTGEAKFTCKLVGGLLLVCRASKLVGGLLLVRLLLDCGLGLCIIVLLDCGLVLCIIVLSHLSQPSLKSVLRPAFGRPEAEFQDSPDLNLAKILPVSPMMPRKQNDTSSMGTMPKLSLRASLCFT